MNKVYLLFFKSNVQEELMFKAMEKNLEGRHMLTTLSRMLAGLHRDEIRRHRLGIAA